MHCRFSWRSLQPSNRRLSSKAACSSLSPSSVGTESTSPAQVSKRSIPSISSEPGPQGSALPSTTFVAGSFHNEPRVTGSSKSGSSSDASSIAADSDSSCALAWDRVTRPVIITGSAARSVTTHITTTRQGAAAAGAAAALLPSVVTSARAPVSPSGSPPAGGMGSVGSLLRLPSLAIPFSALLSNRSASRVGIWSP